MYVCMYVMYVQQAQLKTFKTFFNLRLDCRELKNYGERNRDEGSRAGGPLCLITGLAPCIACFTKKIVSAFGMCIMNGLVRLFFLFFFFFIFGKRFVDVFVVASVGGDRRDGTKVWPA